MITDETAIKVAHVDKIFRLPHERHTSVKAALIGVFRGGRQSYETQHVLKDVSFEIKKGEFFGIVGRNGSGKSTLLKLLASIYVPTAGEITVRGKLTPFIELGVGFNHELTGRENVFLNGALLGFSRKEMTAMYNDIVHFAELERFMDQKLKNYSSGMQVRLAFSIAIRTQSDILLVDEVLAVGDAAFQQKCFDVFAGMKDKGVTMILVTHDMSAAMRFCDRIMLIDNGKILKIGKPRDVADAYLELNYDAEGRPLEKSKQQVPKNEARIESVTVTGDHGQKISRFKGGQAGVFHINFRNPARKPLHFGLQIFSDADAYAFGTNSKIAGLAPSDAAKGVMKVRVDLALMPGTYSVTAATMSENAALVYDYRPRAAKFSMARDTDYEGIARLTHSWEQ